MQLIDIKAVENHQSILYELLKERDPETNISHKEMPSFEEHCEFIKNHPYEAWYLIKVADDFVGAIYLTSPPRKSTAGNEIGIFIFKEHQAQGYGSKAIKMLMQMHGKRRYLANISPLNTRSIKMFRKLGFSLCQYTLEGGE